MKKEIIRIMFSVSAGFCLSLSILLVSMFILTYFGASDDSALVTTTLLMGTIGFSVLSNKAYANLKQ